MVDNANLGAPKGRITIDASSVTQAKTIVVAAASEINRAFNSTDPHIQKLTNGMRAAQQAARDFANTDLGVIQQSIKDVGTNFLAVSAAATAFVGGGIASAQTTRQLVAAYTALLNSGARARDTLTEIRDLSEEFKLPFLEVANGARGFLSVINATGLSMRELVVTAQRLRILNPGEGAEGAAFALRELLSGDVTSIVERFNLSRREINRIKNDANGDVAETLRLLDEYLNSIGVTENALRELGDSGMNAFSRLGSAATEALSTAFTPLLVNVVIPLVDGFTQFLTTLNQTNPELLQTVSVVALAAAAFAPLMLAINQAINAYRMLRTISATSFGQGLASAAGAITVTVAAADIGNRIGIGIAQAMADSGIGDPRLRSDSGEDPGAVLNERLRQVVVIFVDGLLKISRAIVEGAIMLKNAWDIAVSYITEGALWLQLAFLQLYESIMELFGQNTKETIGRQIDELFDAIDLIRDTRPQSVGLSEGQRTALDTADQLTREDMLGSIVNFLFPPVQAAAEEGAAAIAQGGDTLAQALKNAAESPEWQNILDAIAEHAEKLKQENDERMLSVGREAEDYARGRMRTLEDERRANERADRDQLEREREQIAAIEAIGSDAAKQEAELLKKDLKAREQDLEQHNKRLLDIQRAGHLAIVDAIADGDGVAAIRAVRNAQEQTRKENEDYTERQKQRDQDLKDQREALIEQRDERLRDAVQQLEDMRTEFAEQRAEREADFNERLAREDEDRMIRLQREQDDFDRRRALEASENERKIANMQAQFFVESGLFQSFQTTLSGIFQRIRDDGIRYFSELGAALGGGGLDGVGMIGGGGGAADLPFAAQGARLLSDGLVFAHAGEVILNQPQQREWNGGNTYQIQVAPNFTIYANEEFDYEGLVADVSDRVTDQVADVIVRLNDE